MSGFLGDSISLSPWVRRMVTRTIAIVPALAIALTSGNIGLGKLLVFTQVVLSLQLPFAVWPLVQFTSTNKFMAVKCFKVASSTIDSETQDSSSVNETEDVSFANSWIMTIILVLVALLLSIFNIILLVQIKDSI